MLVEARNQTRTNASIEVRPGDATHLDLEETSIDGSWCERLFQHLTKPAAAMSELERVTRPGGRIVVIDTDWACMPFTERIQTSRVLKSL